MKWFFFKSHFTKEEIEVGEVNELAGLHSLEYRWLKINSKLSLNYLKQRKELLGSAVDAADFRDGTIRILALASLRDSPDSAFLQTGYPPSNKKAYHSLRPHICITYQSGQEKLLSSQLRTKSYSSLDETNQLHEWLEGSCPSLNHGLMDEIIL